MGCWYNCTECGEELPEGMRFCPNCGTPAPQDEMQPNLCPGCGKEYTPGSRFCMDCGTKLQ